MSKTIVTVDMQSSQKKKVHLYSGLAIKFKVISIVNAISAAKDIASNIGSTEIDIPAFLISSEKSAQNMKKNIKH